MIARLRRRHRRLVGWVGTVAAIGVAAALTARPARPVQPGPPAVDTSGWTVLDVYSRPAGSGDRLRAALEGSPGNEWLILERRPGLASPDLLVYLTELDRKADAVLLGSLGDPGIYRYRLPAHRERDLVWVWSRGGHEHSVSFHRLDDLAHLP